MEDNLELGKPMKKMAMKISKINLNLRFKKGIMKLKNVKVSMAKILEQQQRKITIIQTQTNKMKAGICFKAALLKGLMKTVFHKNL